MIPLRLALLPLAPLGHAAADGALYPARPADAIIVVYPSEGAVLPFSEGEFIMGSVSDPSAPFSINGASVTVHPNGAFLAWLPVAPGTVTFRCSLDLKGETTSFIRGVSVTPPPLPLPGKPLAIDPDSLWPRADADLRPGDWLTWRMRASPGQKAQARLGKSPWQDLCETGPGLYEGRLAVGPVDQAEPAPVEYRLASGWSSPKASSRGRVSLSSGPAPIAVVKSQSVLRTGPGEGYMAFPLPGTRLATAGRLGGEFRVRLAASQEGWIDAKDVDLLPAGSPPPRAVTGAINTSVWDRGATVRIGLSERVAFAVDAGEDPSTLTVRLFNSVGHTNWIVYDSDDPFVEEVRWKQEAADVVAVSIRLAAGMSLWGWQASYENSSLRLDLRRAPALAPAPASPLKGVTVVLDPGHMPSAPGATGPLGTREMDANFAIATAAAALLAKRGAIPALTRNATDQEVGLAERPRLAVERRGDVFVSIHNNALPDGENPFSRPRGYSVFYYHPLSLDLARQMYRSFEKRVPLPGEELRYGNLLVARLSAMPAVLVETAYMIVPEHEEKLNDPGFRAKLAEAIADGLESFLAAQWSRQGVHKAKPAAAPKAAPPKAVSKAAAKGPNGRKSSRKKPALKKAEQEAALDDLLSEPEATAGGKP